MSIKFEIVTNLKNEKEVDELKSFIQEEGINGLKIDFQEVPIKTGNMGADISLILDVVLNASAIGLAVKGLAKSIQEYFKIKASEKKDMLDNNLLVMQKGDLKIVINSGNINNVDKLIKNFIENVSKTENN
jgi:hypothetical protein